MTCSKLDDPSCVAHGRKDVLLACACALLMGCTTRPLGDSDQGTGDGTGPDPGDPPSQPPGGGSSSGGGGNPTADDDGGTTWNTDWTDSGWTDSGWTDSWWTSSWWTTTGPYECPNGELPNDPLPAMVAGHTDNGYAQQVGACQPNATGRELAYVFVSPGEGFYEFVTTSPNQFADTVLYVSEGETCGGTQIACGDDIQTPSGAADPEIPTSNVGAYLLDGEVVVVVVDTKVFTGTEFELSVDAVAGDCPDEVLPDTFPLVAHPGSTMGQPNRITGSCFGEAGEWIYQWTAPETGTFQVDTIGSSPTHEDTVVYVLDGTSCAGEELACNDDITYGQDRDSKLEVDLEAGQQVLIVVDGWSGSITGDFILNISLV